MTETRTFVGETAGAVGDGYAGFRIGRPYQLTYTKEFDEVRIVLDKEAATIACAVVEVDTALILPAVS